MTILDANRQLNLLIDAPVRPSDVFDQVSLAVIYGAAVLAHYGISDTVPSAPAFDGYKRPADVYGVLLGCAEVLGDIADQVGVQVLRLSPRRNIPDDIEPGHVFDIATIVRRGTGSGLRRAGHGGGLPDVGAPGDDLPTQVHGRASVLLSSSRRSSSCSSVPSGCCRAASRSCGVDHGPTPATTVGPRAPGERSGCTAAPGGVCLDGQLSVSSAASRAVASA